MTDLRPLDDDEKLSQMSSYGKFRLAIFWAFRSEAIGPIWGSMLGIVLILAAAGSGLYRLISNLFIGDPHQPLTGEGGAFLLFMFCLAGLPVLLYLLTFLLVGFYSLVLSYLDGENPGFGESLKRTFLNPMIWFGICASLLGLVLCGGLFSILLGYFFVKIDLLLFKFLTVLNLNIFGTLRVLEPLVAWLVTASVFEYPLLCFADNINQDANIGFTTAWRMFTSNFWFLAKGAVISGAALMPGALLLTFSGRSVSMQILGLIVLLLGFIIHTFYIALHYRQCLLEHPV